MTPEETKVLLEKAAKACGLPEFGWMGEVIMYVKDDTFTDWSPITDDGDLYRLARDCRMTVDFQSRNIETDQDVYFWPAGDREEEALAIVRAAAAIYDATLPR